jgi:hypothetical protein
MVATYPDMATTQPEHFAPQLFLFAALHDNEAAFPSPHFA